MIHVDFVPPNTTDDFRVEPLIRIFAGFKLHVVAVRQIGAELDPPEIGGAVANQEGQIFA